MPHLTTYSFCFNNLNNTTILRDRLKALYPQLTSIYLTHSNKYSCLTLSGTATNILNARADVLKLLPTEVTLSIHSLFPGLAYRNITRNRLHEQLETIAIKRTIQIVVDYNQIILRLIGPIDKVELARIDVLVFFDHLLGLHSNSITMPLYGLSVLGNRHAQTLSIMEDTGSNIYLPSPWCKITQPSDAESESIIHVTGNTIEEVQKATTLLKKLLPQKKDVTKIMRDNGSYIAFPTFGAENNQIQVYAENNINVERTLRSLNYLTSHIFQAIIYVNTVQSADLVARLSQDSGAEVIYRTDLNRFEITGVKEQIQSVVQIIRGLPISQEQHKSVTFSIELALDQREFISGKKNGKINKIMKSCDAEIQFENFNDYNFIITIESEDFFKAKDGLDSLQNELPAEISFFVPEICHRRIIGVAGKNIQRVMKQYGVYVKFSSNDELATFGGYFENEHNVVARTPEKNIHSLLKLKTAVMEFITFQKDRDYVSKSEYVPTYAQRNLFYLNGKYLRDKGKLYNSRIIWPERNGTDHVVIIGPQSHIEEMQSRVQSLLPQSVDIQVPASVVLETILLSHEIEDLQDKIYTKTNIFLILPESLITTDSSSITAKDSDETVLLKIEGRNTNLTLFSPNDCRVLTFKLCFDSNSKNLLAKARLMFDSFMDSRSVPVDDTLHNNTFNGSPSPEDIRHISPSVMHHIDHPESYEGHTKNTNVTEMMEQPRRSNNSHFFQQAQLAKKPLSSSNLHPKSSMSGHFFSNAKTNYDASSNDEFNVWSENPINHENQKSTFEPHSEMSFRPRTSRAYEPSKTPQFYYPTRPGLKPTYSTSSTTRYNNNNNNNNDLNYTMNDNYYQFGGSASRSTTSQQQQDYITSPTSSDTGNNNPFAPIGYSRQRSTSLLPTIGHHHHTPQQSNSSHVSHMHSSNNELKNNSSFGVYPLYVPPSPRVCVGSSTNHDYYMMNSRLYPLERKNPSSSLSTPIPVAVNSNNNNSMQSMNSQRYNFY
ncbi:hypothetical protein HPULCUR_000213 [Helicostylum pulchrum]|uniref:K Homology domain-containing protein n=1 Tax=Helicostylum pulchrum TaxID=562976 RepID=A0ABP9XJ79_9FUNG